MHCEVGGSTGEDQTGDCVAAEKCDLYGEGIARRSGLAGQSDLASWHDGEQVVDVIMQRQRERRVQPDIPICTGDIRWEGSCCVGVVVRLWSRSYNLLTKAAL